MSSYWDYVQAAMSGRANGGYIGSLYGLYNALYDNSHGSDRYFLGKVPFLSWMRRFDDEAKKAQDQYDNTGKDPAYIDRIQDSTGLGPLSGVPGQAARMARSLSSLYVPEVVEDVSTKFNGSYW